MTPVNPDSVRYQSWTARGNKVAYFTGEQWAKLEAGALAAGHTITQNRKGQKIGDPDVISYLMHLHRTHQGDTSQ